MIERPREFAEGVVTFACKGRVAWQDHQTQSATAREWIVAVEAI